MATKGKEYKLAIRIAGVIDKSFNASLATANTALKANILAMDKNFTTLDKGFDATMNAGKKCFGAIATAAGVAGAAVAAAAVASVAVGKEFETAFAGVKKTVDATDEEYAKLRQNILDMSEEIPSSASDIAGVMEIAGQLGIATESLTDFTKTMINLGVSTNLSAEEAATALAKFANVVSMPDFDENGVSNYERLGSVIVDLGNNFATTEEDIVTMATRLASTGDIVGLSEAQIMALATAMSSVGIEAESGGSTMSKLLRKIQVAVETGSGDLESFASVANMTGETFSQTFKNDAVVALSAFIDGLNDTERNGKSAVAVLDDMGIKEVRLTNTILALANAHGVMSDAIDTANTAWDENTALAIEAGKRYETVDSKLQVMKNSFVNLGIAAYEDLRDPLVDVIGFTTDEIEELNNKISGADGISKWIDDICVKIPTLKRNITTNGKPIVAFISTLKSDGEWMIKNKAAVIGVVEGVGTALVSYKIASSLSHITAAIAKLTPASWGIIGVTTAVTGLSAAIYTYNNIQREVVKNNLKGHFGELTLSLQELDKVAKGIISAGNLSAVEKALSAFDELDDISATMQESVSKLDKLNWKVSVGIRLDKSEQEDYKTAINEYVAAAQNYAQQSQYAVALNLSIGFNENDTESKDVVTKVNQFYQDKYDELAELGTELNAAVTDAFNDGFLDIDEAQTISNIQASMAEVQEQLATGEFEAKMSMLELDYSGKELTSDTFQNLQQELNEQIEEATKTYKDAYVKNFASIKAAYEAGDYLSDEEYNNAIDALKQKYLDNVSNIQQKAAEFQLNTITDAYGDQISEAKKKWEETLDEQFGDEYIQSWQDKTGAMWQMVYDTMSNTTYLDTSDRKAISQLLDSLKPTMEEMQGTIDEYKAKGQEIPQALAEGMNDYEALLALSGSSDAVMNAVGDSIANTDKYDSILNILSEQGKQFPVQVASAIEDNASYATDACDNLYNEVDNALNNIFSKGIDVDANVRINLNPVYDDVGNLTGPWSTDYIEENGGFKMNIPGHAEGGIFNKPHLAAFCEDGMEAAIPIDGSANAISLWEETGRLLGVNTGEDNMQYINNLYDEVGSILSGISLENIDANVRINLNPVYDDVNKLSAFYNGNMYTNTGAGDIPLWQQAGELSGLSDRLTRQGGDNAVSMWQQSQSLIDMRGNLSSSAVAGTSTDNSITVEYKPTLQFYGAAPSREDIQNALSISESQFEELMQRYIKQNGRSSF